MIIYWVLFASLISSSDFNRNVSYSCSRDVRTISNHSKWQNIIWLITDTAEGQCFCNDFDLVISIITVHMMSVLSI